MTAATLATELNGRKVGGQWMGCCPSHDDRNPSLAIRDEAGSINPLVYCHAGCKQSDVITALESRGLWETSATNPGTFASRAHTQPVPRPATPQNQQAQRAPLSADVVRDQLLRDGYDVGHAIEYPFGADLRKVRFHHTSERQPGKDRPKKTCRWEHRREDGRWYSGDGGKPKTVYLNEVALERDSGLLLGLEGENKANIAGELGIGAFSYHGLDEDTDLSALATVRKIVLWPDKDAKGAEQAEKTAEALAKRVPDVRLIRPPINLPPAGDIVDAVQLGMDTAGVLALIDSARPSAIRNINQIDSVRSYAAQAIDWLWEDVLAEAAVTLWTGDAGSGKSTLALALCGAIAAGQLFAGRVTRRRPVLYLDRENPAKVVTERLDRLHIIDGPGLRIWGGWQPEEAPMPNSPIITDWIESCEAKPLIVVDSFISFLDGNENDSVDVQAAMHALRRLADAGATVLVLHHTGKAESSKEYRGSSYIKGGVDAGYHLANIGDPARLGMLRLRAFKTRIAAATEIILNYSDGIFSGSQVEQPKNVGELLAELLQRNPGVTIADFERLAAEKNFGRNRARHFVKAGIESGTIRDERGAQNKHFLTWLGAERGAENGLF